MSDINDISIVRKDIIDKRYNDTTNKILNDDNYTEDSLKDTDLYKAILHSSNIYNKNEINLYDKTYRFGILNPYQTLKASKEYLFFTKPDLHILARDNESGLLIYDKGFPKLNSGLEGITYWEELKKYRLNTTIKCLQESYRSVRTSPSDNFNHLLQNQVNSNLDVPNLEGTTVDSPVNDYGVGFLYRGSSESSDDSLDFSLEFKDTKWLDVYYFFKTYEEYETLKHHGVISPYRGYIVDKIIHDQFSIYKFLVDEDMETILYYCKLYGVMPMGLPRDSFSSEDFSSGLSYSISFKAAFFEEMKSEILREFNKLSENYYNSLEYNISTYNSTFGTADFRPAQSAYIIREKNPDSPTGYVYKLKWRGGDVI